MTKISRGLRNNNPGNIRLGSFKYKGEKAKSSDSAFRQFESEEWGYRAMFVLLDTYRKRYGLTTLREMIMLYAPPEENHTALYVAAVSDMTGIRPDEELDTRSRRVMVPIVAAMSRVENGCTARRSEVEQGWDLTGF